MKVVFNSKDLKKELKEMKEGESILLYEREIKSSQELREFRNYVSKLIALNRNLDLKIKGGLIFKKETWNK